MAPPYNLRGKMAKFTTSVPADESAPEDVLPIEAEAAPEPPPPPPPPETKTISLLVDHVYLPEDPTHPGWRTSTETMKYLAEVHAYRVKYEVHRELADFLVKRKQAIEVPPDKD